MSDKANDVKKNASSASSAGGGMVYALGVIGALVYYLQQASSITEGLIGIFKALFWPAFLVYSLLGFLRM